MGLYRGAVQPLALWLVYTSSSPRSTLKDPPKSILTIFAPTHSPKDSPLANAMP